MKLGTESITPDTIPDEVLDLLLDEAERAILDVEARTDEPGRRSSVDTDSSSEVDELRVAIAELSDAFPGAQYELESISDRLRNVGATAATAELESHPHIMHLVRLSLEVFFRQYPTLHTYEVDYAQSEELEDDAQSPVEMYEAYRQLLDLLRQRLS